jgi:hypothetical protein
VHNASNNACYSRVVVVVVLVFGLVLVLVLAVLMVVLVLLRADAETRQEDDCCMTDEAMKKCMSVTGLLC